jgi:ATP-binding cassette subfamily C protein
MTLVAGLRRLRIERRAAALNGRIASRALQLLTGIATLRAGGAEKRAFALWEGDFGHHRSQQQRRGHIDAGLAVLHDCALIVATLVLFSAVARLAPGLGTGSFLAFHAAFLQFLLAVLGLAGALTDGFHLLPLLERAKPILQAAPEVDTRQAAPAALAGDIDISHLSFRYGADSPPVLNDLCVHIAAGEFVAIVGASSSGKSTLLRLLLGFEQPDRGAIYFDGVDLRGLDAMSVRRQMGVVLQHGRLMPGDIYSNIVGTSGMSLDDAWEAARLAGLADDIRAMPMGMHTVIVDAASTLSGGQRQRLLVARAIVARPRILLFDEATSALDNLTQAMVARSIAKLQVTRIVIAHRMSTVVGADRVLVLDGGHIVEQGTFAELLARGGKLAELARCQMI